MMKCLDEIVSFTSGNAWKAAFFKKRGKLPIIRIQNIGENKSKDFVYWDDHYEDSFIVNKGDLLLSLSGSIKIDFWDGKTGLLNQRIVKLTPKKNIFSRWLYYQLLNYIKKIEKLGNHALVNNVSMKDLRELKLDVPSFDDQVFIAGILNQAETLLAKRKESIRLLDELLKSTFLEMFAKYLNGQSVKLEEVASITSGLTKGKKYDSKETRFVPYMRVANVQDGYLDLKEIKLIEATEEEINRYNLRDGDVLLTEGGDPDKLGRGSIWRDEVENCIFQNHIFRVRVTSDEVNPVYLSFLTGSNYGKKYFLKSAKQTTGIASINSTQLKKFPVIIPPFEMQELFAQIVENVKEQKALCQQSLKEMENLYGTLSQKAFKGELSFYTSNHMNEPELKHAL